MIILKDSLRDAKEAGFTPRLDAKIRGAVEAVPPPEPRKFMVEEVVYLWWFFRRVVKVQKFSVPPKRWTVREIEYDLEKRRLTVKAEARDGGSYPLPKTQVVVEGEIIPFSPQQAAALGADVSETVDWSELPAIRIRPYTVWWGTKEDQMEILQDFPHLCGK